MKQIYNANIIDAKWNDLFDDEEHLIQSLMKINVNHYIESHYKGYEFIKGFQNRINSGKELTPKQITQLKRLSKEIYKYLHWN